MRKARLNAIADIAAFPVLLLSLFSSVILWSALPCGGGARGGGGPGREAFLLGLARGA